MKMQRDGGSGVRQLAMIVAATTQHGTAAHNLFQRRFHLNCPNQRTSTTIFSGTHRGKTQKENARRQGG